ncbi:hypothetical protein [Alkaliphilus transvaalensis]|uniref:hypothetical protein n=1 Tax=Alkaliphilus transvaalensis TaxID=114628 RepID=UPI00047E44DC|nr:hypothetical protein [Alkaliphilus transvaalensis]
MLRVNKMFTILFLVVMTIICLPNIAYGNSAEPPSILIIVPNPPDDLEISIEFGGRFTQARKTDKVIEKHYTFYSHEIKGFEEYVFNINTGNNNYKITLDKPLQKYNNIYTLNLNSQRLIQGKSVSRSILLVSFRLTLTLIIEGVVFWLFGFRRKRSWIAFLIINLITQGSLNLWINSFTPTTSYLIFGLIFIEIFIIIAEVLFFLNLTKEHSKVITISYAIVANILSLIVGGYAITVLPI